MDPGLVHLLRLIKGYLLTGHVWWHMPLLLTMAYTLFVREKLLNIALHDSYPNPLPQIKRRCNDPVLGEGYIGCFEASMLDDYGFDEQALASVTPENCVAKCKTNMFSYAALQKGKRCYCGMGYESDSMVRECKCRRKCKGNKKKRCGGSKHASLFETYFCTERMKAARTIDGMCNDLTNSAAGSRFYRFSRNVPLNYTYSEPERLLKPNPRTLARKLLQRKNFLEVPWLNLFAVAWVQFMVHDWFDHGTPIRERKIKVPLQKDDPLRSKMKGFMKILRTKPDTCKSNYPTDPPTYQNDVTHWWDGSQLYGSDKETHARVRSFAYGKLKVDDDGLLPVDPKSNIDITGNTLKRI
ncbi:Prostaglandin G/H synthase 1 [Desmophyllum pertusum]|uniref:Prostaglandin G/H synthase 1 n=1 Tax=Desmophyllum pertusum TaxID=174260 RepID=A0A9X0A6B8_9CNID|nr:Prostaglandin G/H synthase 1 [Desmophyllum pertusum]